MEKQCTRCKQSKSLDKFPRNKLVKDGIDRICKDCHHKLYAANRETILAKKKAEYVPHPKPVIPIDFGKKRCTHCHQQKDATSMFFSRYRGSADGLYNECKVCTRSRRASDREGNDRRRKAWLARDPDGPKRWRAKIKLEMIAAYGGVCVCCGEFRHAFLTIDHIGGRTDQNHPWGFRSGSSIYGKLKKLGWPRDMYRLLCMNCNFAIRWGDPCPHESER